MLLLRCENRSQCLSNWAKTTDAHHQLSLTLNFNFQSKSNTSNYWKRNRNSLRVEAVGKECGCVRNLTYTTNGSPVVHGTRPRLDIKLLTICFRAFQTSRVQNCRGSIIFQFQNLLSFESSIDSVTRLCSNWFTFGKLWCLAPWAIYDCDNGYTTKTTWTLNLNIIDIARKEIILPRHSELQKNAYKMLIHKCWQILAERVP